MSKSAKRVRTLSFFDPTASARINEGVVSIVGRSTSSASGFHGKSRKALRPQDNRKAIARSRDGE